MPTSVSARRMNDILLIELHGPEGYPRLERAVLHELHRGFDAASEQVIHGVVIHGAGRAFATGADLEEVSRLTPEEGVQFSALGQELMRRIERFRKRVVAAVRGYCFGGGLDLALACRLRIATPDARFAHPGGALGIITGWGGTARLPRLVGRARARELLVTGRMLAAEEAFQWGLVHRIVPAGELLDMALKLAEGVERENFKMPEGSN